MMGVKAFVSFLILLGLFLRKTKFLRHQALNGSGFLLTLRQLQIPQFSQRQTLGYIVQKPVGTQAV